MMTSARGSSLISWDIFLQFPGQKAQRTSHLSQAAIFSMWDYLLTNRFVMLKEFCPIAQQVSSPVILQAFANLAATRSKKVFSLLLGSSWLLFRFKLFAFQGTREDVSTESGVTVSDESSLLMEARPSPVDVGRQKEMMSTLIKLLQVNTCHRRT